MALAHLLTNQIQVKELGDYLLGSIIPDVCYFLHRDRDWTHISIEEVNHLGGIPEEKSFETGYKVHLAIDLLRRERKIAQALRSCLPKFIANNFNDQLFIILPDVYYMRYRRFKIPSPQKFDFALTRHLGIESEFVLSIYKMCEDFFNDPSLRKGIKLLEQSRLLSGRRIRIIKAIGLAGVRVPGVEKIVIARIRKIIVEFERQVVIDVPFMILSERL